jgi:hypothetical protein
MHSQFQKAKQRLSELLRRLRGQSMTFMEYLRADPSAEADFEAERAGDLPRD